MVRIFDNIELKFEEGLNKVIGSQGERELIPVSGISIFVAGTLL